MKKQMTCIACPLGCQLTVEYEGTEVLSVSGNTCKRGDAYARTEIVNPTRSLTSTVRVKGGVHPVVPVKTAGPIPKDKMFEAMRYLNTVAVKAPVSLGQVIVEDLLGTGVNVVATNTD